MRVEGTAARLVFALLAPYPLDLLAIAVYLILIALNLLLLTVVGVFVTLQLIADQRPGPETKSAADGCAGSWMPDCRADEPARDSSTDGTDARALLTRR